MASSSSSGGGGGGHPRRNSKRPKYSRFTQQELRAYKPMLTPARILTAWFTIGLVLIVVGAACLLSSQSVVEIVDRYDLDCVPANFSNNEAVFIQSSETNKTCIRNIKVPQLMKHPVYIYYELDNFYQNHRRYVKSRSDEQLRSKAGEMETNICFPEDVTPNRTRIVPCGLIAWSLFNDTYEFSVNNALIYVSKKGIAWKSDKDSKFGKDVFPKNFQGGSLIGGAKLNASKPLSEQEDLMVWMRTATLPNFRKLYRKIGINLKAGQTITVVIQNNYNTYSFGGKKKLVLSTTSWIGGKNNFLGIASLTLGGVYLFLGFFFSVVHVVKRRAPGDPSYLSWNRNARSN